jgi:hypothetical protein
MWTFFLYTSSSMVIKYKGLFSFSFFVALICACPSKIASQDAIPSVINLEQISDYYFDADPALGIDEVSVPEFSSHFSPVGKRPIWAGKHAPASWLRFTIPLDKLGPGYGPDGDAENRTVQWLLFVKPSFSIILDQVELYVPRSEGGFDRFALGARLKSNLAEPRSRFYAFSLPAGAFRGRPCYLRISSATDVLMNIELITVTRFAEEQTRSFLGHGLLFGIIIAMVVYSTFLLLSFHYHSYLFFIFHNIAIGLWVFYLQGFSKVFFGTMPGLDQMMLWIWAGQFIAWGTVFTVSFLGMKRKGLLFYILTTVAALGGLISVAAIAGLDEIAFVLSHYLGIVAAVLVTFAALLRAKQGYRPGITSLRGLFSLSAGWCLRSWG